MSDVKIEDLSPVPFFAHFLENHFSRNLTEEEMKALRGGACAPNEMDAEGPPLWQWPVFPDPLPLPMPPVGRVLGGGPCAPGVMDMDGAPY